METSGGLSRVMAQFGSPCGTQLGGRQVMVAWTVESAGSARSLEWGRG